MAGIPPLPFIQITRLDDDDDNRRPHVATERGIRLVHNDPRVVERDKTRWLELRCPIRSFAWLPCQDACFDDAWCVGRPPRFRQVLMSLNGGRCLRGVAPVEEEIDE